MIEIKLVKTQAELDQCLKIRNVSFIVEQNVPVEIEIDEMDTLESPCFHFLVSEEQIPVGTFRLLVEENGAHLQRFCFLKEHRSKGYGSETLKFLEEYCKEKGYKKLFFDAQCNALNFYKRNGYIVVSDVFEEAGILHVKMEKVIQ